MQGIVIWLCRAYIYQYLPGGWKVLQTLYIMMQSLARNRQAALSPPLPTYSLPFHLFYFCGLLVCKVTTGNKTCQRNTATLMTWGLASLPPPTTTVFSRGVGSHAHCLLEAQCSAKVDDPSLSASSVGGSKGDAEFAQSTHCTVRCTQLFCSQCKYGQPHSSLALLPQHMSRGEGWFSACSWNKHYVSLKQQHLKSGNVLHVCYVILWRREEVMSEGVGCGRGEALQETICLHCFAPLASSIHCELH